MTETVRDKQVSALSMICYFADEAIRELRKQTARATCGKENDVRNVTLCVKYFTGALRSGTTASTDDHTRAIWKALTDYLEYWDFRYRHFKPGFEEMANAGKNVCSLLASINAVSQAQPGELPSGEIPTQTDRTEYDP